MPTQLRTYTINRGSLDTFAHEWQVTIKPLRERLGFIVEAAWTVPETNQFIWMLRYDGPETWEARDAAYHTSDERKAMHPDPARHIARVEQVFLEPLAQP